MKYLGAFVIAIFMFTFTVSAQSRNVLAEGNPQLTQTMAERFTGLMEWSLDVTLTDAERSALRSQLISYWKDADEKSIKSIVGTLAFEQKLSGAAEEQKRNLQPQIHKKLLEEFRKDPQEPLNKILLAIYDRNHGSVDDSNVATQNDNASLAALAGRWQVSHMNSLSPTNRYGATGNANGMVAEYDIKPDGRVIFSFYLSQAQYGCTTKIKTSKTGRATVEGSRINFVYETGTTTSEDSCNAKYNYTKNLGKTSDSYDFSVKTENGKKQFCFADAKLKDCAVKLN